MRTFGRKLCTGVLVVGVALMALPAQAQWYDEEDAPAGEGEILEPFTFKGFKLGPGGQLTSWIAPGEDLLGLTFLLRGGYALDSIPIYIGLEVPLSYGKWDVDGNSDSEFVLGQIGLNFKSRVDPDNPRAGVFTGWSFDIYIPTFMGDVEPQTGWNSLGHYVGLGNTLRPGIHTNPESINLVGTFDLVLPGNWFYFQFELSAATYIPVTDYGDRGVEGGLLWGFIAGVNIAKPIGFLVELKAYTPLGVDQEDGTPADTSFAISPGFRMQFGPFRPAVWVTFPLDKVYRQGFPDVIIGVDLGVWF